MPTPRRASGVSVTPFTFLRVDDHDRAEGGSAFTEFQNLLLPFNGLSACEQRQMFLKFGVRQGNRVGIGYGFVDN